MIFRLSFIFLVSVFVLTACSHPRQPEDADIDRSLVVNDESPRNERDYENRFGQPQARVVESGEAAEGDLEDLPQVENLDAGDPQPESPRSDTTEKTISERSRDYIQQPWVFDSTWSIENKEDAESVFRAHPVDQAKQIWSFNSVNSTLQIRFEDPIKPQEKFCVAERELPMGYTEEGLLYVNLVNLEREIVLECQKKTKDEIFNAFFKFPRLQVLYVFERLSETEARLYVNKGETELKRVGLQGLGIQFRLNSQDPTKQ